MHKKWTEEEKMLVTEYYCSGHSATETGKKFGRSKYSIENFVKENHLSNGRTFGDPDVRNLSGLQAANEARHQSSVKRKAEEAERRALIKRQRELERQKKIKQDEELRKEKAAEKERAKAEKADALFHMMNDKSHVCSVCGKYFSVSEFMESKGRKLIPANPKYCSHKCNRKAKNKARKKAPSGKSGNYYVRARKYGCEYTPGITLKKLVLRDGLKCQICGGMCDWSDHSWTGYSGPTYPSMDHKIPLAKGGGHVWENVQVAHLICNSEKGGSYEAR